MSGTDPRVDTYIEGLPEWQEAICRRVRALIAEADPEIEETIKRTVQPYFVLKGNVAALLATNDHVNVFLYDPGAPDPAGIINRGHDNATGRQIAIYEGDDLDEDAFRALIRSIADRNRARGLAQALDLFADTAPMLRRLVLLLVPFLALSGFSFYTGTEKVEQPTTIGTLHFTVTFCATNTAQTALPMSTAADGTVTEPGSPCATASSPVLLSRGQGLIVLRVPAGWTLPDALTLATGVTAAKNASLTTSLGAPPAGMQYQGYVTPALTAAANYTTSFDLPLPATHPFAGPVKARVLGGYRSLPITGGGETDDVACANLSCVNSLDKTTDFSFPTRDLGVGTPATGTLDFPLTFKGAALPAGSSFALTATTTVPAASAAPADATFAPTVDQQKTEKVTVTVPIGTDPGAYDVTLTAKLGSETRSGTGKLTVAAPTATPTVTVTATPTKTTVPVVTVKPTVVPTVAPTPTPAKRKVKKAPKAFTLTVKPTGPRSFKVRGRLKLPKGVARADGCAGIVRLKVGKVKKTTIVTGSCTFSRTLKVSRGGSFKVTAAFTGNSVLKAKKARGRRFRAS